MACQPDARAHTSADKPKADVSLIAAAMKKAAPELTDDVIAATVAAADRVFAKLAKP